MASMQSNSTFSFKHHLTGEAWPACRAILPSLQSNSTFSFKHHLTGEAWLACRAILPFHSNTDLQGMASLAILASLGSLHIDALDTWVSHDVAYGQPLRMRMPWRSNTTRQLGASRFARLTTH